MNIEHTPEGRELTLGYTGGRYVLMEHLEIGKTHPYMIVCEMETAGEVMDFVIENYDDNDVIQISDLMTHILEFESQQRMIDLKNTFSKITNSTLANMIRSIMNSFGITGSVEYFKNDEDLT